VCIGCCKCEGQGVVRPLRCYAGRFWAAIYVIGSTCTIVPRAVADRICVSPCSCCCSCCRSAAIIHQQCLVDNKDISKFLDAVYVSESGCSLRTCKQLQRNSSSRHSSGSRVCHSTHKVAVWLHRRSSSFSAAAVVRLAAGVLSKAAAVCAELWPR
jgi:hypothetical protein